MQRSPFPWRSNSLATCYSSSYAGRPTRTGPFGIPCPVCHLVRFVADSVVVSRANIPTDLASSLGKALRVSQEHHRPWDRLSQDSRPALSWRTCCSPDMWIYFNSAYHHATCWSYIPVDERLSLETRITRHHADRCNHFWPFEVLRFKSLFPLSWPGQAASKSASKVARLQPRPWSPTR